MENIEQILQKLVAVNLPPLESDKVQHLIQHAFEAGKAEKTDPLEGYSNLTEAIESGPPIDWERLDGLKVQCVKPELGALRGKLDRDICSPIDDAHGWWDSGMDGIYIEAFDSAWCGRYGWTLWVEGDIPLIRKTADELEVGRFFTGKLSCTVRENLMCVADEYGRGKHVRFAADFSPSRYPATEWVVIEEHGTFQKPEGK